MTHAGKCVAQAFAFTQHMIVCLVLQAELSLYETSSSGYDFFPAQQPIDLFAQEQHRIKLIAGVVHAHPNEMDMIGHETVDRRE